MENLVATCYPNPYNFEEDFISQVDERTWALRLDALFVQYLFVRYFDEKASSFACNVEM